MKYTLPKACTESFIKELDKRNLGSGGNGVSQALEKKIEDLVASLQNAMHKVDTQEKQRSQQQVNDVLESACFNMEDDSEPKPTSSPLLVLPERGKWSHFWKGRLRQVPENFSFGPHKTLLSLWLSWHVPDVGRKVCLWRYLQYYDLENINRGVTKHREMGVVVSRMINEIFKSDELRAKYVSETGQRNVNMLTDLFEEASKIFITPKRKEIFGQLSWETFVKEARKMKLDNYKPDKKRRLPDNESTLLATNPEAFATPTREPRQQPQQPQQPQQLQQEVER